MNLRSGYTTGTCAAAAAKAAAMVLCGQTAPAEVDIDLPNGQTARLPVQVLPMSSPKPAAAAAVKKDAGDDPDVTHGLDIIATVWFADAGDITFLAGEGVGTVTKPGLQIPPGEPAINPVPRQMIRSAVRQVTDRPVCVQISIPGGREIARKTFNPRLGVVGGLSILGTTGIVRPYSIPALRESLRCAYDVAAACGVRFPVIVPGNIGHKAARHHFRLTDEQVIEAGNEWGFMLDQLPRYPFQALLVAGHPGKLAKFVAGDWDTHSSRSSRPTIPVIKLHEHVLGRKAPPSDTIEGIFATLNEPDRSKLGDALAAAVQLAVRARIQQRLPVAVQLVNMQSESLGTAGDLSPWR